MRNTKIDVPVLFGVQERQPQRKEFADEIVNMKVDPLTGGWDSRIGYEKFIVKKDTFVPWVTDNRIDSMYYWIRRGGALDQVLYQTGTTLKVVQDWNGDTVTGITLANTPKASLTNNAIQFCEFGKWLIITYGDGQPLKYSGWPIAAATLATNLPIYSVGFKVKPRAPRPRKPEVDITLTLPTKGAENSLFLLHDNARGQGVGKTGNSEESEYRYKVSFVSNTGSEGPLSDESMPVQWTNAASGTHYKFCIAVDIPIGPSDVVARRIYRTTNGGTAYYLIDEVKNNVDETYHDLRTILDAQATEPLSSDSVAFPATGARYCAVYQSCLFLDGGPSEDTALYYSHPLKPDQFGATDYLELGMRKGGGITGLVNYFNFLIVLRSSSIDIISGSYPNFNCQTILQGIGSTAIDSAATIPEMGIVFATFDGVYLLSGNMEYIDKPELIKLSEPINKTWRRVNKDHLSRAAGCYSHKHKEYHLYVCVDGSDIPNLGLVYHVEKKSWSFRENFPVSCIDTDGQGNIIFGHNEGAEVGSTKQCGLFVISGKRQKGSTQTGDSLTAQSAPSWKLKSPWLDFGDASVKKKVHHVALHMYTTGDQSITMKVRKDFSYTADTMANQVAQRPEYTDQITYDVSTLDGTNTWQDHLLTTVRWDTYNSSCNHFQFEVSGTGDVIIIGYEVLFTANQMKMIKGKTS